MRRTHFFVHLVTFSRPTVIIIYISYAEVASTSWKKLFKCWVCDCNSKSGGLFLRLRANDNLTDAHFNPSIWSRTNLSRTNVRMAVKCRWISAVLSRFGSKTESAKLSGSVVVLLRSAPVAAGVSGMRNLTRRDVRALERGLSSSPLLHFNVAVPNKENPQGGAAN